jgi:hypothetical protein
MLAGEGLHPSSKGVRVRFSGTDRSVTDGPFTETKEMPGFIFKTTSSAELVSITGILGEPKNFVTKSTCSYTNQADLSQKARSSCVNPLSDSSSTDRAIIIVPHQRNSIR